jgi:hypothetical protein
MEYHAALLELQEAGVVRTNFMQCDETSLYVFSSFIKSIPTAFSAERFDKYERYRNVHFVERCAFHLRNSGNAAAADIVTSLMPDADLSAMTVEDALIEHKKAYLGILLELCHGLIKELADRHLVSFEEGPGFRLPAELKAGYETAKVIVRVKSSHISPKALFERIAQELHAAGFVAEAERIPAMYSNLHYL